MKPAPRWALPSVRPHEDHVFDRRQVQAPRGVEPSRTNRPSPRAPKRAEAPRAEDRKRREEARPSAAVRPPGRPKRAPRARSKSAAREPAVLAPGAHPVPYRTRKLSPWAPRVLRPQGRGRVGRRRLARGAWRAGRAETHRRGPARGPSRVWGGLRAWGHLCPFRGLAPPPCAGGAPSGILPPRATAGPTGTAGRGEP